jgi:hypothetical protein
MPFLTNSLGTLFEIIDRETKKVVFIAYENGRTEGLDTKRYSITNYWPIYQQNEINEQITKLLDVGRLMIPGPISGTRYKWLKYLWLSLRPWGRKSSASRRGGVDNSV